MHFPSFKTLLRIVTGPLLAAILFAAAVRLLMNEAQQISREEFMAALTGVPWVYLAIAAMLVAMNYGLYITYDILALRYVRRPLPLRRVALVSFVAYTLGNNLGTLIAGTPLRFRFYSRWGLSPAQILALIACLGLTFWSGVWFLGGIALICVPVPLPPDLNLPVGTRALGVAFMGMWLLYLLTCILWHKPVPVGHGMRLRTPQPGLMLLQTSVAAVDLTISATALYLVLPVNAAVPFALVLSAFLVAIAAALATQVPGGLGVLEVILLSLLKETVGRQVLASVLIFRLMYYVIPMLLGMLVLVANELWEGAEKMREARRPPPSDL